MTSDTSSHHFNKSQTLITFFITVNRLRTFSISFHNKSLKKMMKKTDRMIIMKSLSKDNIELNTLNFNNFMSFLIDDDEEITQMFTDKLTQ
ncbi:hypothetical protein EMPG_13342 [Blastomyces silverae]|uniref:Uncharacterized protein n=1 Tax=Blastomyces silverae TaxID=2060906 RepID=A0A0H1BIX9_9EURO|nr:hypothetical protein EMPG_13342 [Blastomyces silverae]